MFPVNDFIVTRINENVDLSSSSDSELEVDRLFESLHLVQPSYILSGILEDNDPNRHISELMRLVSHYELEQPYQALLLLNLVLYVIDRQNEYGVVDNDLIPDIYLRIVKIYNQTYQFLEAQQAATAALSLEGLSEASIAQFETELTISIQGLDGSEPMQL